jgi:hypothetical protein
MASSIAMFMAALWVSMGIIRQICMLLDLFNARLALNLKGLRGKA